MLIVIRIVSAIIILLGLTHITFAMLFQANTDTLWFVGAGFAIVFAGLLNLVAVDKGGSKFTHLIAFIVNLIGTVGFCLSLPILNEPQVYVGMIIFAIPTTCFLLLLLRK